VTARRPPDRRTGIFSDVRGGLLTFLIEAGVVIVAIVVSFAVAAVVLALV
jgi:hypothetical protein